MKKIFTILTVAATALAMGQTPCSGGSASGYPCNNFDLQSHFTLSQMQATGGNDSWGWTDPQDGKEYALIGLNNGTAFIDISDPVNPVYLGKLPTHSSNSIWRDIKVYDNHAFVVSEAGGHGMQVFDLTRLRNVNNPPQTFTEDAHLGSFGGAHNIAINEDSGYAYVIGAGPFSGGPIFINIQDPENPQVEGGYALDGYSHDAQIVTYNGPDTDYTGREIFVGSNENMVVVVDVTDKANPTPISSANYPNVSYTHQGWFTEDRNYFMVGDEIDELNVGFNTRTIVFDFSDLDNPQLSLEYFGSTPAIDHNGYVVGNKFYLANYSGGLRVYDISDLANNNITEYGYFDTFPNNNNTSFDATWNVYPFFASGNIVISGDEGFTLVRDPTLGVDAFDGGSFAIFPNPATDLLNIESKNEPLDLVKVYNVLGQQVLKFNFADSSSESINISSLKSGIYLVQINNSTTKRLIVN